MSYDRKQAMNNLLSQYVIYQQLHPNETQAEANRADEKYRRVVGVGVLFVAALFFFTVAEFGRRRIRYPVAVLGFEALLGLSIVVAALSLVVASNAAAVVLCLGIVALAGPLFWKLIRAMARIQMPDRRPPAPGG